MAQEHEDQAGVKTYRCRAVIEALRWTDTDENREQFAAWFEHHDAMFETRGAEIALPTQEAGLQALVPVGDWIIYDKDDGAFVGISHDSFTLLYEELR